MGHVLFKDMNKKKNVTITFRQNRIYSIGIFSNSTILFFLLFKTVLMKVGI